MPTSRESDQRVLPGYERLRSHEDFTDGNDSENSTDCCLDWDGCCGQVRCKGDGPWVKGIPMERLDGSLPDSQGDAMNGQANSKTIGQMMRKKQEELIGFFNYWNIAELEAHKCRAEALRDRLMMLVGAHDHAPKVWNVWQSIRRLNNLQGALSCQGGHTADLFVILSHAIIQQLSLPEVNMIYTTKTTICVPCSEDHWNVTPSFIKDVTDTFGSEMAVAIARAADKDKDKDLTSDLGKFRNMALRKEPYPVWWNKSVLFQLLWCTLTDMLNKDNFARLVPIILRLSKNALKTVPTDKHQMGVLAWTALPCVLLGPQMTELPIPTLRPGLEFQDRLDSIWTSVIPKYVFELSESVVVMEKRCVEVRDRTMKVLGALVTLTFGVFEFLLRHPGDTWARLNDGSLWPVSDEQPGPSS